LGRGWVLKIGETKQIYAIALSTFANLRNTNLCSKCKQAHDNNKY
jgi:hypothetical protein